MVKRKFMYRDVALMAIITFALAFFWVEMPEYYAEIKQAFVVIIVISAMRTVHMGFRVRH